METKYKVGDKIKFAEEKRSYVVQACNERFLVCTKPFNLQHTVLYTIVDLKENVRGTDGYVFGLGYETRSKCEESLSIFTKDVEEGSHGVSHRNRIKLNISDHIIC